MINFPAVRLENWVQKDPGFVPFGLGLPKKKTVRFWANGFSFVGMRLQA